MPKKDSKKRVIAPTISNVEAVFHKFNKKKDLYANLPADIRQLVLELDSSQAELEIQNEELENALHLLEVSERRYFETYENAPTGYLNLDKNNRIVEVNSTMSNLLGISKALLMGRHFTNFISKDDQDVFFIQSRKALSSENKEICELKLTRDGGLTFYAYIEIIVAKDSFTKHNCLHLSVIDVTIRKLAEEDFRHHLFELNQSTKISALEALSSTLAHEINQPIGAVNNFISACIIRLESKVYQEDDLIAALKTAKNQIERAGRIVHSLEGFIRKGHLYNKSIDINEVIKEAVHLMNQERLPIKVEIHIQLLNPSVCLFIDKLQIELVLLNLMRNSIEAMVEANTDNPKLIIQAYKSSKSLIKITVSDNGPGITKEVSEKLFKPFFTTKPHGLGIGLAICYAIVLRYGGNLYLQKDSKIGACFELTLPINRSSASAEKGRERGKEGKAEKNREKVGHSF